jgi:PIN domain nuclease of toxin-antitoxin system
MSESLRIVLDTHVWIWLLEESGQLSRATIRKIDAAAKDKGVLISAISLWEICLLSHKKRIEIEEGISNWLEKGLAHPGVVLCPLTVEVVSRSYKLSGTFHGDPADRMIVATSLLRNATLITRDAAILAYGAQGHAKVLRA